MRVLRRNHYLLRDRALLVLRMGGGLQRNQRSCHLRGLPHDPPCQGVSVGTQYIYTLRLHNVHHLTHSTTESGALRSYNNDHHKPHLYRVCN
jgi:hypothetical protein